MKAPSVRALLLALATACVACDNGAVVLNVAPAVTAVGPAIAEADGLHVYVWLRDYDRDPVDLRLTVGMGGSSSVITKAGGHGLRGLTTTRDAVGEPHELILDVAGVAPSTLLALRIVPVDTEGEVGTEFATPEFALSEGLPTP